MAGRGLGLHEALKSVEALKWMGLGSPAVVAPDFHERSCLTLVMHRFFRVSSGGRNSLFGYHVRCQNLKNSEAVMAFSGTFILSQNCCNRFRSPDITW